MSHLIAGFPDAETSIAIADALVKGGANILEIQLAFSDPSADGPAIQTASTVAPLGLRQDCRPHNRRAPVSRAADSSGRG